MKQSSNQAIKQSSLESMFNAKEFTDAMNLTSKWDFSLTKQKLLEPEYANWTNERIEEAEKNYKRYLSVTKALNGYQLVPNGDVDRFWHEHILDTRRYAEDCSKLFGGFLHHYPFFGMRDDADNSTWIETSTKSTNFWNNLFGEHLYHIGSTEVQKCPQRCPNGIVNAIQKIPQKCPQKCPGAMNSIDIDYRYLPDFSMKKAA